MFFSSNYVIITSQLRKVTDLEEKHVLERIQERSGFHITGPENILRLNSAQRALAQWALVDDYQSVLDLNCGDGRLLRYLKQKFALRICGVSDNHEYASFLRSRLPDAEVIFSSEQRFPWQPDSFDTVFYQPDLETEADTFSVLRETMRVLKPDGQLLIATGCISACSMLSMKIMPNIQQDHSSHMRTILTMMENAGYQDVSCRLAGPFMGIAMGWKRH